MNNLHRVFGTLIAFCFQAALLSGQEIEIGLANYYSDGLNGNPTAYGEVYDRTQFTAAHRNFSKGTLLKVTRLDNRKSVFVRVNDRGPFSSDGAIVSLSMAAASLIDLTLVGHAQVKIEPQGYADNNAAAANYNIANSQSSNAFAFDRIYNGTPQEVPQDYFTPRGTQGTPQSYNTYNTYTPNPAPGTNNNMGSNNQTAQYGPVPPSYDRRFQSRGANPYPGTNDPYGTNGSQTPNEYYNGGASYNNYTTSNNTPNNIPNSYGYPNTGVAAPNNSSLNTGSIEGFPTLAAGSGYSIQLGSYSVLDNATRQAKSWMNMGLREIYLQQGKASNGTTIFKVFAGRFDNRENASIYANQIKRQFLANGFVTRL